MKKNLSKMTAVFTSVLLISGMCGMISVSADESQFVITQNGDYLYSDTKPVTVSKGVTATVTLKNAVISSDKNAFTLEDNSDVTIILDGTNTLSANPKVNSAGIFVPQNAKLTIKGVGTLNVTGGNTGAGIGSIQDVVSGTIIIDDGIINAIGGKRGAGIGSGYHASAGDTTINGGTITAIGTDSGAGIGTGYGTSGGGKDAKVGVYAGGNITINGGKIRASAFPMNFDNVDPLNPDELDAFDNSSFAAGIGGGYGSSSGNVQITGGDIIALGSCGGAGIGSGRGTSQSEKYDENAFFTNISISGNAKVIAMATNDKNNKVHGGGAAIGSGRGTHTGGTISITGNADVVAIASSLSSAIGAGSNVNPVDGTVPVAENIKISNGVKLYAVSDGTRYAVDTANGTKVYNEIDANIQQILFDSAVLNKDASTEFTLNLGANPEKDIVVPMGMKSVAVNVDKADTYYVKAAELYGVQKDDSFEYISKGTLSEQTCVALRAFEVPDEIEPSHPIVIANEYAYIFGRGSKNMEADNNILRGEASAVLYRLLKQNNSLGDYKYDSANTPAFTDLNNSWDRSAIEYMAFIGIYQSDPSAKIYGANPILRSEAFKLFSVALGITKRVDLTSEQYADLLLKSGYIHGDENGNLNLDKNITRAEYCKIYNIIIGRDKMPLIDNNDEPVTAQTYGFIDLSEDDWYYDVMLRATSAYTDGRVDMTKRANRNKVDDYQ